MSSRKKQDDKVQRIATRSIVEVLTGESDYPTESPRLRRLGIETGPDLEDLLNALKAHLDSEVSSPEPLFALAPDLEIFVLQGLLEVLTQRGAVNLVAGIQARRSDKDGYKACGSALHRLEIRGIRPQASERTSPAPVVRPGRQVPEALLSVPLPGGHQRVLQVFDSVPPAGAYLLSITLDEIQGFGEIQQETEGVRALRRGAAERLAGEEKIFWRPIEPSYLLWLLEDGLARARTHHVHVPFVLTYLIQDLRNELQVTPVGAQLSGVEGLSPIVGHPDEDYFTFMRSPELLAWEVPPAYFDAVLGGVKEASESPIYLDENIKTERVRELKRREAAKVFTPERRLRFARRLHDMALNHDYHGDRSGAELCYRSALTLETLSIPVEDVSFIDLFLEAHLLLLLMELAPDEDLMEMADPSTPKEPELAAADGPRIILPAGRDD